MESLERQLVPGHALAPAGPSMARRLLRGAPGVVQAVQAPDARIVRIVLGLPSAPLLTALAHPGLSVVAAAPGADGSRRWVGTGSYAVTETAAGKVTVEASGAYWGPAPRIARVVFFAEPDEARATAGLALSAQQGGTVVTPRVGDWIGTYVEPGDTLLSFQWD